MTERELLEMIEKSAEAVEIPESITPEAMKKKLDKLQESQGVFEDCEKKEQADKPHGGGRKIKKAGRRYVAAAAVLLVCGVGIFAATDGMGNLFGKNQEPDMNVADVVDASAADDLDEADAAVMESGGTAESQSEEALEEQPEAKKDAGDLYVVAEGYGDVYDVLYKNDYYRYQTNGSSIDYEYGVVEDLESTTGTFFGNASDSVENSTSDSAVKEENVEGDTAGSSYSRTNVQMEGVDESDIIKTDGSYIYVVDGSSIHIVDVTGESMEETGEIDVAMSSASDQIEEMYVSGNTLNLIVTKQVSELKEQSVDMGNGAATTSGTSFTVEDVLYFDSNIVTELLTYDISDPKKPKLTGRVTQDGYYKTSRKIGDVVYLFTEKYLEVPQLERSTAIADEEVSSWLPLINGEAVAYDCIYVPEQGSNSLMVSSVDVKKPDQVVDNVMIVNDSVDIYVSTESLYLYGGNYENDGIFTEIAKFSLKKGNINAVGAASVGGDVYDTFAINEYQGKLRLLTTDWSSGEDENNLYLFDQDLKLTGKLTGIAPGEQIYAARYFRDTAYFVTYRNTDPLFAVDLSDEKNPKILSELKITGFSEYLHFWGEDKLLGIGYETDPDTGATKGLKITMFDISNPAELTTLGTCVIENVDYSPALYNYKCVLVDAKENMIGFMAESYQNWRSGYNYLLFKWEDGKFKELMTESIDETVWMEQYRGLYVDEMFYLASPKQIISYDREDDYRMTEKLEL